MAIDLVVAGAATLARLTGSMTVAVPGVGATFTVDTDAGWPLTGKFAAVIDRGQSNEETVLVNSRVATTFTVGQRGYDGTAAADHDINATVELDLPATIINALIQHENGLDLDPHPTTLLNNTRHDVTARHVFGGAFAAPAAPPAIVLDAASATGVGTGPARADHNHGLTAAAASTVTGANAEGASANVARADHNHAIGGTNHIPAAALVNNSVGLAQLATAFIERNSVLFSDADMRIPIIQAAAPGSPVAHDIWFNTTKLTLLKRNAANTQWEVMWNFGPWQQYTPTLFNFTVGGSGLNYARYTRHGSTVIVNGFFKMAAGATTSAALFGIGLPPNAPGSDLQGTYSDEFFSHGGFRATDVSSGGAYAAVGVVGHGTATFANDRIQFIATAGATGWNNTNPFTWEGPTGDRASYFIEYETAQLVDANFV